MSTDMLSFRAFPSLYAEKLADMFSDAKTSGSAFLLYTLTQHSLWHRVFTFVVKE